MARHLDWQMRLMQYLAERARTPVDSKAPVCALFAAGAVHAMTGVDLAADWQTKCATTKGALRAIRTAGFEDHIALVHYHFEEIPVSFAAPGDIAIVPTDEIDAIGIVQGEVIYVQAEDGIGAWPLLNASRAFRVI